MRAPSLLLILLSVGSACAKASREAPAPTFDEVKQRLGQRDARLTSFRFSGASKDGPQEASFEFAYRAPQRMRAALTEPVVRTFAFDGKKLYEQSDGERLFHTFDNQLSADKSAGFLTQTFGAFIPEGYRVPLLPRAGVTVRRATHPKAAQVVELTLPVDVSETEAVELTYVLRWPELDFLGKRTRASDGSVTEVRVEAEHCDAALKLCVPARLTRWRAGQREGETTLAKVELNPALPSDLFTLAAPEGYTARQQTLVDAPAADAGSP